MERYWQANKATAEKVRAFFTEENAMINRACEVAKKMGATGTKVLTKRTFGELRVVGFIFSKPPDKKGWLAIKGVEGGYGPRNSRSKEAKEIRQVFDELRSFAKAETEELVFPPKTDRFVHDDRGLIYHGVGVVVRGKNVFFKADAQFSLRGCKRITDVQFEKMTA